MNDITNVVHNCSLRLFADDTCLLIEVDNHEQAATMLNEDLAIYRNDLLIGLSLLILQRLSQW